MTPLRESGQVSHGGCARERRWAWVVSDGEENVAYWISDHVEDERNRKTTKKAPGRDRIMRARWMEAGVGRECGKRDCW